MPNPPSASMAWPPQIDADSCAIYAQSVTRALCARQVFLHIQERVLERHQAQKDATYSGITYLPTKSDRCAPCCECCPPCAVIQ